MIELGVFARSFPPGPAVEVAQAIRSAGFSCTQLNLSAIGRPTLDDELDAPTASQIAGAFDQAGVRIWGVSGTFNAIDPNLPARRTAISRCQALIRRALHLRAGVVTLCTGTRDPDNIWRAHADNTTAAAWADLRATLDQLIPVAADAGVQLGVEPEGGNVIRDARAAERLWNELGGDARHLTLVLDPANLLDVDTLPDQQSVLDQAFDLLGPWIGCVHAKDVVAPGAYSAAGAGGLDYDLIMARHAELPTSVPIIAQDLTADDAPRVATFLTAAAQRVGT